MKVRSDADFLYNTFKIVCTLKKRQASENNFIYCRGFVDFSGLRGYDELERIPTNPIKFSTSGGQA